MAQKAHSIKFFLDSIGNTFSMWLDDPRKETHAEMNELEDILMLDKNNKVIGFEKINFLPEEFIQRLKLKSGQIMKKRLLVS